MEPTRLECVGIYSCKTTSLYFQKCINGSGYVEVRLKSYKNKNGTDQTGVCCDNTIPGGCEPCDPYVKVYLTQGASRSNLSQVITTGNYNNTNTVRFGNNVGGTSNPFKLTFANFSNSLVLTLVAMDDDRFDTTNKPMQILEELRFNVGQGEPAPFYTSPAFVAKVSKGNAVELEFEYRISCDQYFYGICGKYCKPKAGQYNCSRAGNKVCDPGWSGAQCDTGPCQNNKCEHNSTCVPNHGGGYNCSCSPFYSGKLCDVQITPLVVLTTTTTRQTSFNPNTITSTRRKAPQTTVAATSENTSSNKLGLIVGCSVAAVVLIAALLTVVVCLYLKNKHSRRTNALPSKETS